ncbi:MAG: nitroreductase family protein [Pseudomonadota bacterium]
MTENDLARMRAALALRFGDADVPSAQDRDLAAGAGTLAAIASRRSHRSFEDRPVPLALIETLAAIALSAPSKSDLQQRDIVVIDDAELKARLLALVSDQAWTAAIPRLLIFCGNNHRQRRIHDLRGHPFANDHVDAVFNAAVDAGIALQAFITAAEATGLGCCPISTIRNHAQEVSDLLALPDHVFPVAGLAVGWPAGAGDISQRLPLAATVHLDRFDNAGTGDAIAAYDKRRADAQPYASQRGTERFGQAEARDYTWSEDKARQYAEPERADFGAFLVKKGFRLT